MARVPRGAHHSWSSALDRRGGRPRLGAATSFAAEAKSRGVDRPVAAAVWLAAPAKHHDYRTATDKLYRVHVSPEEDPRLERGLLVHGPDFVHQANPSGRGGLAAEHQARRGIRTR